MICDCWRCQILWKAVRNLRNFCFKNPRGSAIHSEEASMLFRPTYISTYPIFKKLFFAYHKTLNHMFCVFTIPKKQNMNFCWIPFILMLPVKMKTMSGVSFYFLCILWVSLPPLSFWVTRWLLNSTQRSHCESAPETQVYLYNLT